MKTKFVSKSVFLKTKFEDRLCFPKAVRKQLALINLKYVLILFSNYENEKRKSTTDFRFIGGRKTNFPLHDTRVLIQCCIHNIQMGFNSRLFCIRKHVKSGDKQRIASKSYSPRGNCSTL